MTTATGTSIVLVLVLAGKSPTGERAEDREDRATENTKTFERRKTRTAMRLRVLFCLQYCR